MIERIFEKLGGPSAISRELRKPLTTVTSWRQRGRIPDWHHDQLLKLAQEKGVSLTRDDFYA